MVKFVGELSNPAWEGGKMIFPVGASFPAKTTDILCWLSYKLMFSSSPPNTKQQHAL